MIIIIIIIIIIVIIVIIIIVIVVNTTMTIKMAYLISLINIISDLINEELQWKEQ